MKIKKISQSAGVIADVVNSLDSNSSTDALSANQGKVLNEKIEQCKVIDVDILPEITDENRNQILRYNGDLYAVANTAVDIPLAQGMQIGGKKLIFNWPFQITQYPTTIDTHITVFTTTGDIVENFNLNAYHLYGNTTVDAHTITFGDVYINDLAISQTSNIIAYYGNFSSQYEKHTFQYGAASLQIPDGDITIKGFNTTEASELLNCFRIREYQLAWNKISEPETPKAIRYFYLDNSSNKASYVKIPYEEGMSWAEFIASDYNRNEFFYIDGGGTIRTKNNYILTNIGGYSYEGTEFQEIRPETYIMTKGGTPEPN